MSTLHHEDMLLQIFDEVQEAFPYLDEEANRNCKQQISRIMSIDYDEILKLYEEGDFTLFDLKCDLYYQLFYSYPETKDSL